MKGALAVHAETASTPTTLKLMVTRRRVLAGMALVIALVATGMATPAWTGGPARLATGGNERSPALTAYSVGVDVAVLANKLEHFGSRLSSTRQAQGRSAIPSVAMGMAVVWALTITWRRYPSLRAVPLVVAHPLSGIARRAPPSLQLTGR